MKLPSISADSTVGKTIKVVFWLAVSGAVAAVLAWVTSLNLQDNAWLIPAVNVVLVFVKNLADRNVENY